MGAAKVHTGMEMGGGGGIGVDSDEGIMAKAIFRFWKGRAWHTKPIKRQMNASAVAAFRIVVPLWNIMETNNTPAELVALSNVICWNHKPS
jgi:hypothetical protein